MPATACRRRAFWSLNRDQLCPSGAQETVGTGNLQQYQPEPLRLRQDRCPARRVAVHAVRPRKVGIPVPHHVGRQGNLVLRPALALSLTVACQAVYESGWTV